MTAEDKKLERPRAGRMLAGVCAAIAGYFGLDVTLVRVGYVLLTLFTELPVLRSTAEAPH